MNVDPKETKRREKEARARHWARMMDSARRRGLKFIPAHENPYLHDSDFQELVEREKRQHLEKEKKQHQEREQKIKAEKIRKDKER